MNDLQVFKNPKFGDVRTITEGNKVLFCGADIAKALGYKNPRKALNDHCRYVTKRYVGVQTGTKADGTPATQQIAMSFILEGDVYRLAAKSELPGAAEFESWIFDVVLPSIRKTGGYAHPDARPVTAADYIKAASIVADCADKRLPIVIDLLRHAGLEINAGAVQSGKPPDRRHMGFAKTDADIADQLAACQLLRTAIDQYGLTRRELAKLIGVHRTSISHYIYDARRPTPDRARLILAVVPDALPTAQS